MKPRRLNPDSSLYNQRALRKPVTIEARLRWHMRFDGLYARTAKQLGVDPSYVCRVANGLRNSEKVMQALQAEMKRVEKLKPK